MSGWQKALPWVVAFLVPAALILAVVRLMLTPFYIQAAYRLPGFPPDPWGFTQPERLHWAEISRQYLLNDAGMEFLGDRHFSDGKPLFNGRELRHMADVKRVVQRALRVWYGVLTALAVLALLSRRFGWGAIYRRGLMLGGWFTVGLTLAVLVLTVGAFQTIFVDFHRVFFEGNTWLFARSDTLIRLFPERFWRDAFVFLGGMSLLLGRALAMLAGGRGVP